MAAPNIANLSTITGKTEMVSIANANTSNVILSNASSSNVVLKINTIMAVNTSSGGLPADVTVKITNQASGAGTSFSLLNAASVPGGSSLIIIGKDNPLYLEENRSIIALASTSNYIGVICSYEQIS